jgi:CheY-like chemotaxis protein
MLGHELRNPLAAITNAVTIVRSAQRTPEHLEFAAGVIARQSAQLKRLIDDLLQVGRVMSGKILLERQPLDLAASVRHVASTLEAVGRFSASRLELDVSSVWVHGDLTRIEQIVTNLLTNAAAHAPGGRIRVKLSEENRSAVLRVEDDGAGIAAEHLARIFDLFYQAEPTTARTQGGLGIGLTLVQRLVELHGGTIVAESGGRGLGAAFIVRIPAIAAAEQAPRKPAARKARPQQILVVEDNDDARESLRVALELEGHRVLHAADAPSALEQIRRAKPPVAIIDIGLPGMDGYALARAIRSEVDGTIRLIALTGYGTSADVRRALDAGFDSHLTKPVDIADLAGIISPD